MEADWPKWVSAVILIGQKSKCDRLDEKFEAKVDWTIKLEPRKLIGPKSLKLKEIDLSKVDFRKLSISR